MKCNAWIYYGWTSEKAAFAGKPFKTLCTVDSRRMSDPLDLHLMFGRVYPSWLVGEIHSCQGTITVDVSIEHEPYFGGSTPVLSITCRCTECKTEFTNWTEYDHESKFVRKSNIYPDESNVEEWLTQAVEERGSYNN